jgi:hypothetical protein
VKKTKFDIKPWTSTRVRKVRVFEELIWNSEVWVWLGKR